LICRARKWQIIFSISIQINVPFQRRSLHKNAEYSTSTISVKALIGMALTDEQPAENMLLLERFASVSI
jgi:hypothetical protein